MDMKILKAAGIAALVVASIVTVLTMLRAATWSVDLGTIGFLAWAISPYICFLSACTLIEKFTSIPRMPLILCVVSILMLGFTILAYIGTFQDASSTYALIFLFVPIYLFVGSFTLLILGVGLAWIFKRKPTGNA